MNQMFEVFTFVQKCRDGGKYFADAHHRRIADMIDEFNPPLPPSDRLPCQIVLRRGASSFSAAATREAWRSPDGSPATIIIVGMVVSNA